MLPTYFKYSDKNLKAENIKPLCIRQKKVEVANIRQNRLQSKNIVHNEDIS